MISQTLQIGCLQKVSYIMFIFTANIPFLSLAEQTGDGRTHLNEKFGY